MSVALETLPRTKAPSLAWARGLLLLLRARAAVVLVLLLIAFTAAMPAFLHPANLSILSKHVAIAAMLAIGMTLVVLTGGIDLSVGSVAGLSGMLAGYMLTQHGHSTLLAVVVALVLSLSIGTLNGLLVARAGVAPFIATLGTMYIARGAALLLSDGKTFPNLGGTSGTSASSFPQLGQSFLLGLPTPVCSCWRWYAVTFFIAGKTPFGRHVYAVGGNERAARLAGIDVKRVKLRTYLFSSFCAAIVGMIIAAQLEAAHPATGESFELNAIAAVVLGGTSLLGGRGTVTGSLLGAFVIGVLADGLVMLGVSEFWQMLIKGVVIVLAVAVDQLQTRLQARLLPLLTSAPEQVSQ